MSNHSRQEIQFALRKAIIAELERLDLPQEGAEAGRALHRVARALTYETVALLMSCLPPAVAFSVVIGAAKKAIAKHPTMPNVGILANLPPAKA